MDIGQAFGVLVTGILVVFLVLILLTIIIKIYGTIVQAAENLEAPGRASRS